MTNLDYYLDKIKKGFPDRDSLMSINPLVDIEDIEPLFEKKLTYKEYIDLNRILRQKYIVEDPSSVLKDLDFSKVVLPSDTRSVYLMGSKSDILDFSKFEQLEKVFVVGARKVKSIILPKNDCVKALGISSMTNLEKIENIFIHKSMRYLHFDSNLKLSDFYFIRDLNRLIYLSFTANKKLPELDFINQDSEIRFLDFVDTNIFKYPSTIEHLKKLKNLRFLTTGTTNEKQRELLRTELKGVCIRDD